ncbi:ABC transporter substrate-binding protein [Paracoccus lichenicola]|nr:ABC transporter substrate-binding protein [Paracoccus lichenicola]
MKTYWTRAAVLAVALGAGSAPAWAEVTIGYLAAMTGSTADMTGEAGLHGVKLAIEDFGGQVNGEPITVLVGDHLGKPDVGLSIAREWIDQKDVNILMNVDNSAVALAVSDLIRDKDVAMAMGSSTSKLIGESCGPNQMMMLLDNTALARAVVLPQIAAGSDKWFFITVDYALGHDLQAQATKAITEAGAMVVGSTVHSPQATDFSAQLLEAQASGATNIALATFGAWQNTITKQAQEFGIEARLSPFYLADTDIKSAGLDALQNVSGAIQFYWDQNDATRAFAERFRAGFGRPPVFTNAYMYEFTRHYLKGVEAVGSTDAAKVTEWMRQNPIEMINGSEATIRADGYTLRDVYSYRTKTPAESKGDWDYLEITGTIAADDIAPPLAESTCPLVKG